MLGKRWTYTSFSRVYVLKRERERVRKYKEKKNKIINMINDIIKMKKKTRESCKNKSMAIWFHIQVICSDIL